MSSPESQCTVRFFVCRLSTCFFFNDTATTEIYTLSLHDALPILVEIHGPEAEVVVWNPDGSTAELSGKDRKSTRLNSSHSQISYAVFCLKKKKKKSNHCFY